MPMRLSNAIEPVMVAVFLVIGILTMGMVVRDNRNSNDFRSVKIQSMRVISNSRIVLDGEICNFSATPVSNVSVKVDAYDAGRRIIGTGTYSFPVKTSIGHADTLPFAAEISVPEGYKAIRHFMIIPSSERGTGKPLLVFN